MKRWIHASEDQIDYKIKDYLADWAKDDVKNGNDLASFGEFKEEMKKEGLKVTHKRYDYYTKCYENAAKGEKSVNSSKKIFASKDTEWIDWEPYEEEGLDVTGEEFEEEIWQSYLGSPENEVNEELGIFVEPSVQGSSGAVFIYDESGEGRWASSDTKVDWYDWCEKEFEMAREANNAEEYKKLYRQWMKEILPL